MCQMEVCSLCQFLKLEMPGVNWINTGVMESDKFTGRALVGDDRPESHLGLRSQLDLAPKRLESRLSYHIMTRLDLKFS